MSGQSSHFEPAQPLGSSLNNKDASAAFVLGLVNQRDVDGRKSVFQSDMSFELDHDQHIARILSSTLREKDRAVAGNIWCCDCSYSRYSNRRFRRGELPSCQTAERILPCLSKGTLLSSNSQRDHSCKVKRHLQAAEEVQRLSLNKRLAVEAEDYDLAEALKVRGGC